MVGWETVEGEHEEKREGGGGEGRGGVEEAGGGRERLQHGEHNKIDMCVKEHANLKSKAPYTYSKN